MGQSFDPDQNRKLPPVAPPPRKVGAPSSPPSVEGGNLPEMAVFRGLAGSSSQPAGSFKTLPPVTAPPSLPGRTKTLLPQVNPPPRRSSIPGEGIVDSITRVNGGYPPQGGALPIDTVRDNGGPPSGDALDFAMTTPEGQRRAPSQLSRPRAAAEPLDWDDEEESTHVFDSSRPPPPPSRPPSGPHSGPRLVRPSLPSQQGVAAPPGWPGTNGYSSPPTTDTVRLDTFEAQSNGHVANGHVASAPPERTGTLRQGTPAHGGFPPPPPIPSITQARPLIEPARPMEPNPEVVRDQPFVRLPSGNPHTATELALKKPVLAPATFPTFSPALPSALPPYAAAPASDARRWLLGAGAATALLSIVAIVAFFLMRRPGEIEIEVKDARGVSVPRAEVFVDGRKVCDSTPCNVPNVEVGRHSVRVITPDDPDRPPLVADVEAGKVARLSVTIEALTATLVVANDQAGVRLFVDGADRGTLPAKLTDLTPGKHDIKLTGERYKAWEKSIEVKEGETVDLGAPRLAVTKGRVLVTVKTEGATIELVRADSTSRPKLLEGPFPRPVEVPIESGTWKLVAKKRGLPDFVAPLDFSDGVAEKTIEVKLGKEEPEAAVASNDAAPRPNEPRPIDPLKPDPVAPAPAPKPEATSDTAAASGTGFLNINSIPASRVLLDGKPLGETPKMGVQVSPGTHTVTFIHAEHGKKSVSVKVGPGETKTASARLKSD